MPAPAGGTSTTKKARVLGWSLFGKGPDKRDVEQSGDLANCPLASILAALAHTATGRAHIKSLITEKADPVIVDLADAGELADPPAGNKLQSNRYFVVKVAQKAIEVSDVFYTDDADRGFSPIYMRSPTDALWPSVIEKAFAVALGGYEKIDALTANETWTMVLGKGPRVILVDDTTDLDIIRKVASNAATVPTIGASRDSTTHVSSWHGFAILGISKSLIELYDPMKKTGKIFSLADSRFRGDFKAILH